MAVEPVAGGGAAVELADGLEVTALTGIERSGSGGEGEAGLAEEGVDEVGPALDGPEPGADHGLQVGESGGGVVAQAGLHPCPGALDGVEVGGVAGQVHDGQPVGMRLGELAYLPAAVGV